MTKMVSGTHISRSSARHGRGRCSRFSSGIGAGAMTGGAEGGVARTSTLANGGSSAEADARVEERVADVRDDLRQHRDEHRDQGRRLDHIDVAEQRGVEEQLAEAGVLEE